jgi:hypothetical protein
MKINSNKRAKRIKEMEFLYSLIVADSEKNKEYIYKIIKETIDNNKEKLEEKLLDAIYENLENVLSITLSETKKMYNSFNENKPILLEDILYKKDGKTLEERVHHWMKEDNIMDLFFHMCLILDTETFQLIHQVIKNKVNVEYVEIIGEGGCEVCAEYCDGEVYKEDEIELPPYHPGCLCEVIFYEKEDVLKDID